jgi:hypothetical protein
VSPFECGGIIGENIGMFAEEQAYQSGREVNCVCVYKLYYDWVKLSRVIFDVGMMNYDEKMEVEFP